MAKKNNQIIWAIGILLVFIVVYSYQGNREAQPILYDDSPANFIETGRAATYTVAGNLCSETPYETGLVGPTGSQTGQDYAYAGTSKTITCTATQCHLIIFSPDYSGTLSQIQINSLSGGGVYTSRYFEEWKAYKIEMQKDSHITIDYAKIKQIMPYSVYSCEPATRQCSKWLETENGCGATNPVDGTKCAPTQMLFKEDCTNPTATNYVCAGKSTCFASCTTDSQCLQYEKCSSGKCTLYWCPEGSYRNVNHGCSEYPKPQICCQKQDGSNQVYRATACYTFSTWGGLGSGSDTQVDDTLCAASLTGIPSIAKNEVSTSTTKVLINSLCEFNGNVRGSCADEGQCASIYALKKDGYIDQAETDSILRTIANAWEKENTEADSSVLKWMAWNALKVTPGIGAIPAAYDSYQAIKDVKAWWDGTSLQPEDKERAVAICVSEAPKFDLMQWIKTNIGLEGNAAYIALGVLGVIVLVVLGSLLSPPKPRPTTQI